MLPYAGGLLQLFAAHVYCFICAACTHTHTHWWVMRAGCLLPWEQKTCSWDANMPTHIYTWQCAHWPTSTLRLPQGHTSHLPTMHSCHLDWSQLAVLHVNNNLSFSLCFSFNNIFPR